MERQGGRVRGRLRESIFAMDNYRCCYCLLDLRTQPRLFWTIDHVIPRRDGGGNAMSNLITACFVCNSRRGATPIHRFVGRETLLRLIRDYARVAPTILGVVAEEPHLQAG